MPEDEVRVLGGDWEHGRESGMQEEFHLVGKVKEAHGLQGELYILVFSGETEWLSSLDKVSLSTDEGKSFQSYRVQRVRAHKKGFIFKSAEIKDRTEAEAKKGALAYIPADLLVSAPGEKIYLAEIAGFTVFDRRLGELGRVKAFSTNGVQDLIVVQKPDGETEIEIPLVEAFIERIGFDEKMLFMDLPEGLVEE